MVIFLLWLGFVCCSVANGIIYDHVSTPERYYYMVIPSIIAVVLIIIHRVYTQDWCNMNDKNKKKCETSHHFQVFGLSAMFSAAMFMSALLCLQTDETSWGFFIGSVSAFVSFCFVTSRESSYI